MIEDRKAYCNVCHGYHFDWEYIYDKHYDFLELR